jgi:hypothetical protein
LASATARPTAPGDVEADGVDGPALARELGAAGLEHGRIVLGEHDRRTVLQERLGGAEADAAAAARDEGLAASEVVLLEEHGRLSLHEELMGRVTGSRRPA